MKDLAAKFAFILLSSHSFSSETHNDKEFKRVIVVKVGVNVSVSYSL